MPKSVRLAKDFMNTVEIRIAILPKAVIKYQGKCRNTPTTFLLPRNTSTFLQASATKNCPVEIINWVQLISKAMFFLLSTMNA